MITIAIARYREGGEEAPVEAVAAEMRRMMDTRMAELGPAGSEQPPRLVMECG